MFWYTGKLTLDTSQQPSKILKNVAEITEVDLKIITTSQVFFMEKVIYVIKSKNKQALLNFGKVLRTVAYR